MSFSEFLIVIIIFIIFIKPEDLPFIVRSMKKIMDFIINLKKEILQNGEDVIKEIESTITTTKENLTLKQPLKQLNNTKHKKQSPNHQKKNYLKENSSQNLKQINHYLKKISKYNVVYNGDYNLNDIKKFYLELKDKLKK